MPLTPSQYPQKYVLNSGVLKAFEGLQNISDIARLISCVPATMMTPRLTATICLTDERDRDVIDCSDSNAAQLDGVQVWIATVAGYCIRYTSLTGQQTGQCNTRYLVFLQSSTITDWQVQFAAVIAAAAATLVGFGLQGRNPLLGSFNVPYLYN